MNFLKSKQIVTGVILFSSICCNLAFAAEKEFISIGTGSVTGVYYPTGSAICRLVNAGQTKHNIHCTPEATGGSVYNINAMHAGQLNFGISQSDWQYHAYNGTSVFGDVGPFPELRAVFSLHAEPINIVARKDSKILSLADLKGKRINVGNPGSGDRATFELVMKSMGWSTADFAVASELKGSERSQALCDNKIDAFVYVVGHPNGSIKEASTTCDTILVPVQGPQIDKLLKEFPFYGKTIVPGGMYKGTTEDTISFGVLATLVSSTKVSNEDVYQLVKAVFENFTTFKRLHPAFALLKKEDMVTKGITIPIHPGALRYYKEVGLIK